MSWHARRARLRALLAAETCVFPASVHDPLSARAAGDLGFEMALLAGSVASLAVLGAPDLALLTLSELAGLVLRIGRAADLPLLVDGDHGYGNALNVRRTVEELEIAGAAGLSIEDTALPAGFGATGAAFIPRAEGVGKLRAALAARRDPALVIAARTGTIAALGLPETLDRARAYAETGADALFLTGIRTWDELDALAGAVSCPLILGTLAPALDDPAALAARRVRIALQGHLPFQAGFAATVATLRALRAGARPATLGHAADAALLREAAREREYQAAMADYLEQTGENRSF
jgi:carboxyvinyl-carboxyphosphonate phosphorylmutase